MFFATAPFQTKITEKKEKTLFCHSPFCILSRVLRLLCGKTKATAAFFVLRVHTRRTPFFCVLSSLLRLSLQQMTTVAAGLPHKRTLTPVKRKFFCLRSASCSSSSLLLHDRFFPRAPYPFLTFFCFFFLFLCFWFVRWTFWTLRTENFLSFFFCLQHVFTKNVELRA